MANLLKVYKNRTALWSTGPSGFNKSILALIRSINVDFEFSKSEFKTLLVPFIRSVKTLNKLSLKRTCLIHLTLP